MNRQDAKIARELGREEPSAALDAVVHRVIGAAIEVHRDLGPGFLEHVAQTLSYLKSTRLRLALLINFDVAVLQRGIKRIIHTP